MSDINPRNVTTDKVRFTFVYLFQPRQATQDQEPKYSITMLIPKSDTATMNRISAAMQEAGNVALNSKWNGQAPAQVKNPIWDGDGVRDSGEAFGPECKGCWVITASSKQQPNVYDINLNPIIDQTQIYPGMYGRANINFAGYNFAGRKGIGCYLVMVQKVADGELLGGNNPTPEQAFGAAPMPAQSYQQPQQQGYAQPQQQPQQQSQQQQFAQQPQQQRFTQQQQPIQQQQFPAERPTLFDNAKFVQFNEDDIPF